MLPLKKAKVLTDYGTRRALGGVHPSGREQVDCSLKPANDGRRRSVDGRWGRSVSFPSGDFTVRAVPHVLT